jgi:hypothetical protein
MRERFFTFAWVSLALCACTARVEAPVGMLGPGGEDPTSVPVNDGRIGALHSRLLLGFEYQHAIEDLLSARAAAAATPPTDVSLNGLLSIGAGSLSLGLSQLEMYEKSARLVAEAALADPAARAVLIPCEPLGASDADCMNAVAATFAPRVLRRPLTPDELEGWAALGRDAALQEGSFDLGVRWLLTGLLLSPDFLYLNEVGRPHPEDPALRLLTGPELASRMSFFLTGSTPPDWLRVAAQQGELDDAARVREAAKQLLAGPRGDVAVERLMEEVFGLSGLDAAAKDSTTFPGWSLALADSMKAEFRALVSEAARDDGRDFRAVFEQKVAWVDARLAAHYGLPQPATPFERVVLPPESGRGGLLSLGSFLARHSHPVSSSPTLRGKFVRERMLCQAVDAPPTNVTPSLPPVSPSKPQTTRQRHESHMTLAGCSGCHQLMDPLGFAFEHFDPTGAYRSTENGLAIDTTGTLDGTAFDGAADLGHLLATDPKVHSCLLRTFFRQAMGRLETEGEDPFLKQSLERFQALNGAIKPWLVELVSSPQFRMGRLAEGSP